MYYNLNTGRHEKIMIIRFISIGLLLTAPLLNAEPITLKENIEIQKAHILSQAIDNVTNKVMACMSEPNSSREDCVCSDLDTCRFKKEFDKAVAIYCATKSDYPSWEGQIINYSVKGKNRFNALSMEGLERQLGKYCK
jgi:hypothetical protein